MNEITYRKIEKTDYEEVKKIINEAFKLYKLVDDKELLNKVLTIYLHSCLQETTYSLIATKDNKPIGVILGNVSKNNSIKNSIYHFGVVLSNYISIALRNSKEKKELKQFGTVSKAYQKLLEYRKDEFQGSITLFAVREGYRGFGIGKTLVNNLLNYMRENQVKKLYLFTDTICNYGFYESQGFKRVDTITLDMSYQSQDSISSLDVFLYSYDL
ncbi:GNAT family N-acetyltransferase [Clostridium perfringens]|nr:GNAT family N-acetyltransferase [Clostridium perfringens]